MPDEAFPDEALSCQPCLSCDTEASSHQPRMSDDALSDEAMSPQPCLSYEVLSDQALSFQPC
eukprot:7520985-Pyramimonas_sp.AAC.1